MSENPLLLKGFTSGWIQKFFTEPFDPLCVMLAMRTKLLLDLIDEMGKSYNLLRMIGFGWIDFGPIPGETPGSPDGYYPPEMNNPIIVPPEPGASTTRVPGQPGYGAPLPGRPGYLPPPPAPPAPPTPAPPPAPPRPPTPPPPPAPPRPPPIGGPPRIINPTGSMSSAWGFGFLDDIGGHRVGGGGGAPGLDCCLDKDNPAAYVHIGYATLAMDPEEIQGLTLEGANPLCGSDHFTWSISPSSGSLNSSNPFAPVYTAPVGGVDCVSPVACNLMCDGVLVDSISIVINPNPPTASIGFTSNQMQIDEQQDLTAVPGSPGCGPPACTWVIASGGGTLSSDHGDVVTYTAPATNANCVNNPTIELRCGGAVLDTLQMAVNQRAYEWGVIQVWDNKQCIQIAAGPPPIYKVCLTNTYYNCYGAPAAGYPCETCVNCPQGWDCDYCYANAGLSTCLAGTKTVNQLLALSPIDERSASMKESGCCPAAAL